MKLCYIIPFFVLFTIGCSKGDDNTLDGLFAGGATTVFDETSNAFAFPCANLSAEDAKKHTDADAIFERKYVTGTGGIAGGLGPQFNNISCNGCHFLNGRAQPPTGNEKSGLLLRLSIDGVDANGGPLALPGFGGQLQNFSDINMPKEADYSISFIPIQEIFPDQEVVYLQKPVYLINNSYIEMPVNFRFSPRIASIIPGLGLLEALSESTILEYEDINDKDKDGISGKANYGWSEVYQKKQLGRFGWKAAMPSLIEQSAAALNQDMGITNPIFTKENCEGQSNCIATAAKPDIDRETLELFAFYCQTVAVPAPRNLTDSTVQRGKRIFTQLGCNKCHRPSMKTGQHPIVALSNQIIFPYTDMLLHDMGDDLADGRTDFLATGKEWRTPPLWGIGLTGVVNNHTRFMHDGRARSLEEAILWHGGEAIKSKKDYKILSKSDRQALLKFLNNL